MRKKLFTLLLAIVASLGTLFAEIIEQVQIGDLYYNLYPDYQTASVTYKSIEYDSGPSYNKNWNIVEANIPSTIVYENKTYQVNYIGPYAFCECKSLASISIPNGIKGIGSAAFAYCENLTSIVIPNGVTCLETGVFGTGTFQSCSSLTSVEIPNSVTTIESNTFKDCVNLSSVVFPNSVTSIGVGVFSGCTSLTEPIYNAHIFAYMPLSYSGAYTIPEGIVSIGGEAFLRCTDLTSVTIPNSVRSLGTYSFYGCSGLTSVTIPNSVTSIGESAFYGCTGLTSVTIGNSVTSIGDYAFSNCSSLTSVTIPNSVTSIGRGAFSNCSSLTSVTIPNSVTSIGDYAFFYCSSLTSVTIPNSVTSIGDYAFFDCSGLKNIYLKPTIPPTIYYGTFDQIASDAVVHVPFGCTDVYKTASYWKNMNIVGPNIQYSFNTRPSSASLAFEVEDTELQSIGIQGGEQQPGNVLEYIGLEPNKEYNDISVVLTANTGETDTVNVSFTTTALELTTKPSKTVSATTAILLAETNMSDAEVSCGFEYKRNDAPDDMAGTKVFCPVTSGQMAGRLKGLKDDVYYKYRAFYQSKAGNMYYGDWQYIFTGDNAVEFDPILYTYGATVVRENEATISGYALAGSEDFTEQGFEYWAESRANNGANAPCRMPAALNEHFFVQASGISLRVTLTNLDAGTVYKYRVYGKVGDHYYYGSEQAFTTTGTYTPPTYTITFANWDGTELQTSQVTENEMPEYTGATPERPEDEQYTYSFNGWTPAIVIATADATYTATYTATPKSQGQGIDNVQRNSVQCTKILHNGQIYILRGDKIYTLQGQEVK